MSQISGKHCRGYFQRLKKTAGLLLALLITLSVTGWSAAAQGDSAGSNPSRKITVLSEEEYYKKTGAAPAQEILSPEEYKLMTKMMTERFGKSAAKCHVHCQVGSDGTNCWKHGC
jgi:hypothetical protein